MPNNIDLKQLSATDELTQAKYLGVESVLTVPTVQRDATFTTTLSSSRTFESMIELEYGTFNINNHLRMLLTAAHEEGVPLSELTEKFYAYIRRNFTMHDSLLKFVASATGSTHKPVRPVYVARQTPTRTYNLITEVAPSTVTVFQIIANDWICMFYKQLGWLLPEVPVTYNNATFPVYPNFQLLVDMNELMQARRFLEAMGSVDMKILADALNKKSDTSAQGIAPSVIAQYMTQGSMAATDSIHGRRASEDIVRASLNLLTKRWDPELPRSAEANQRLFNDRRVSQLSSNLSLFLIAQEVAVKGASVPSFSTEEMIDEIIPSFSDALATSPIYHSGMIADTIGHLGLAQAKDHTGRPILSVLHENWKLDNTISAFDTVRVDKKGELRFLIPSATISSRLTNAMAGSMNVLNLNDMVTRRIGAFEAMSYEQRTGVAGGVVSLIAPSVVDFLQRSHLTAEQISLIQDLKGIPDEKDLVDDIPQDVTRKYVLAKVKDAYRDQYFTYMHYAVCFASNTSIGRAAYLHNKPTSNKNGSADQKTVNVSSHAKHRAILALTFSHSVMYRMPVGRSPIVGGRVATCEPLEIMAYTGERSASLSLTRPAIDLDKTRDALHAWNWHRVSTKVNLDSKVQRYVAEIGNASYPVDMQAKDALGTGHIPKDLRYLEPSLAKSIVGMWFDSFNEIELFYDELSASEQTGVTKEAIMSRRIAHALELVSSLRRLGATTIGQNAGSYVYNALTEKLIDANRIDAITGLQKGVESVRFETWCGFAVLTQLNLLTSDQRAKIAEFIRDNNAIAASVARDVSYDDASVSHSDIDSLASR